MDASAHTPPYQPDRDAARQPEERARAEHPDRRAAWLSRLNVTASGLRDWWTKVNNDWVFNLAGLLAYNFLMSVFPILLVLLAIAGFFLNLLSPSEMATFQNALNSSLPGGSTIVSAATHQLQNNAGILFVLGVGTALVTGSRLFVTIENCFSVVFRLRPRTFIRQNLMALGMLLLYTILIPLIVLGSVIPSAILRAIGSLGSGPVLALFVEVAGILVSVAGAFVFLAVIYVIVPNRKVRYGEVWKGTLAAAALLVVYNLVFPFYESHFLHANNYGSVAGFAIVILVFFYYLGFILLIGAEINSWAAGQRQTLGNITAILNALQTRATTASAVPTAGPRSDDAPQPGQSSDDQRSGAQDSPDQGSA